MKKLLVLASLLLAFVMVFSACGLFGGDDTTTEETTTADPNADGDTTTADPNADGDTTTADPNGDDNTTTEDPNANNGEPMFDNVYHVVIDTINGKGAAGADTPYPGLGSSAFELGRQNMVDAIADEIQVNSRGRLVISGWIALFGGVNKYQYRVNEGEWLDATGATNAPATYADIFMQFGCFASEKNAAFQAAPLSLDLTAYDGQTVTVEVAAIPEIMPEARVTMVTIIDLTVDIPEVPTVNVPDSVPVKQQDAVLDVNALVTFDTINGEVAQILSKHSESEHIVAKKSNVTLTDGKLTLEGWAVMDGGQEALYWSLDQYTWYAFVDGDYVDAEQGIIDAATHVDVVPANGRFGGPLTADLSSLSGKTLDVYVGLYGGGNMVEILRLTNVTVQ